jgi:adenine-specific DNA-methyltransferase
VKPYYEDDAVTLYQGRCEDVLPGLSLTGSVHLLTDPPYFKVKDDAWDNQWGKAAEFLDWMGEWLDLVKPHLSPDASVWVFASAKLTSAVESVVAQRFRVLNSVRWVKPTGDTSRRADIKQLRSFLSHWEGILFAEMQRPSATFANSDDAAHRATLAPVGQYIKHQRESAGFTRTEFAVRLGYTLKSDPTKGTVLPLRWERGAMLPTAETYERMRLIAPGFFQMDYGDLSALRAQLLTAYRHARRKFDIPSRDLSTDVWTFDNVGHYPGKHPCEKPAGLLTHMIETTTRPGDTIIDCFAGSGAVLDVARQLGRKAVGIEMDPHWCRQIEKRLSEQTFDLEGIA